MRHNEIRRWTVLGMLSAAAILCNILESVYIGPLFLNMRIGLANIASLIALLLYGKRGFCIVSAIRVITSPLLQGTLFGSAFWISLAGVSLSVLCILILRTARHSLLFLSILSAVSHSLGQVLAVCFLYRQAAMAATLPYYVLASIAAGLATGMIASLAAKHLKPVLHI